MVGLQKTNGKKQSKRNYYTDNIKKHSRGFSHYNPEFRRKSTVALQLRHCGECFVARTTLDRLVVSVDSDNVVHGCRVLQGWPTGWPHMNHRDKLDLRT